MYISQIQMLENNRIQRHDAPAESSGGQAVVSAFKNMFSAMLAPVITKDKANETFNKKFTAKTGKEEKIRTIDDAIGEIEAIVRKMGLDNNKQ